MTPSRWVAGGSRPALRANLSARPSSDLVREALSSRVQTAKMDPYTMTFTSISQTNGRPTTVRHRCVTPHTDGQNMLQEIVLAFAEGHEAVRLVSSDGKGVDIDLIETVRSLQAGDQVPGISQDSQARTGVILVGAPQRPIQQQQSILASPSIATPPPGAPSAKACKKGRI